MANRITPFWCQTPYDRAFDLWILCYDLECCGVDEEAIEELKRDCRLVIDGGE